MVGPDAEEDAARAAPEDGAQVPARVNAWQPRVMAEEAPVLTVDAQLIRNLATRALAAGIGGLTKVGVASVRHGEGATTIARSLALCLAQNFAQRVVLVEANQRSPCLRELCGLPPGAGLAEVLSGAASLEAALRMSRSPGKMLVLPSSLSPIADIAGFAEAPLRTLIAELFFYADAVIFDLAPLLPYHDTPVLARALDGVALVIRAGRATRADSTQAVAALHGAGIPILGAVLNREKRVLPGLFGGRN